RVGPRRDRLGCCVCRARSDSQLFPRHPAHGGLSGGDLAPAGLAPAAQGRTDEVGIRTMREPLRRAVFLDRDGVLNRAIVRNGTPHPPATLAELEIAPDASRALDDLKAAGFLLIGVTNQPDVARGNQSRAVVESINAALLASLPLQEILVCYHDDGDGCDCRKPRPGLLFQGSVR